METAQQNLIKRNIIANLAGNGWAALLSFGAIPLYIHYLGIEAYGLIGISVMLFSLVSVLDMGMTVTLGREMARLSTLPNNAQESRDLVRSLEIPIWLIALFIGIMVNISAPFISQYWIKPDTLHSQTIQAAVILMGISIAFQWPTSFYASGLVGLQRQVLLNVIIAGITTIRCVGAVVILWRISSSIQVFFIWQIIINILQTVMLAFSLWRRIPYTGERSRFQKKLIKGVWQFTAGAGGTTVTGLLITQMDKIILSKLLTLEAFGYYSLASAAGTSFSRLVSPLVTAVYPRLTQLVILKRMEELQKLYHRSCQLLSVLIVPTSLVLAFFSEEILTIWTHNPLTAQKTHWLMFFLTVGALFNGLSHLPLSLQYARGRINGVLAISFAMVVVMAPVITLFTKWFGLFGAAVSLPILFFVYTFVLVHFIHRQLSSVEKRQWYFEDVGAPLVASLVVIGGSRVLFRPGDNIWIMFGGIIIITILAVAATSLVTPEVRRTLSRQYNGIWEKHSHVA